MSEYMCKHMTTHSNGRRSVPFENSIRKYNLEHCRGIYRGDALWPQNHIFKKRLERMFCMLHPPRSHSSNKYKNKNHNDYNFS